MTLKDERPPPSKKTFKKTKNKQTIDKQTKKQKNKPKIKKK